MAIKSFTRSTIENNIFYRSMLAGNAAFSPPSEVILAEEVLTSTQASVTFSSLGTLAAGYQHLQIRMATRDSRAVTANFIEMRFNADTGANYVTHKLDGDGSSVSSSAYTGLTFIRPVVEPGANAGANIFGASIIDILDPFDTNKYATTRTLGGYEAASPREVSLASGLWMDTSALTEVLLRPQSGSFVSGSRFTLIGLK